MLETLHNIVAWMTRAHDFIMTLNDRFETRLSDKQLHFIVIGAIGLLLLAAVYPVFRWLARRGRVLAITWIYALTVLVVLTFAIEIGQRVTGTGYMEFGDIAAGLGGFVAVTAAILALRLVTLSAKALFGLGKKRRRRVRAAL